MALFALAVQFVLSFGHIHRDDIFPAGATAKIAAALLQQQAGSPDVPTHKSGGKVDDICAICALMQLAAVSAPSAAPSLPLPVAATGWIRLALPVESFPAPSPRGPFRSRAPPLA